MPYGKIDWSTWTKAAMAQTIDTLMARQTELLNQIAKLERAMPYVQFVGRGERAQPEALCEDEGIGRQQSCDACRTPADCDGSCQHRPEDTLGAPLDSPSLYVQRVGRIGRVTVDVPPLTIPREPERFERTGLRVEEADTLGGGGCGRLPEVVTVPWRVGTFTQEFPARTRTIEQCGACSPEDGCDPKAANCERAPATLAELERIEIDWNKL